MSLRNQRNGDEGTRPLVISNGDGGSLLNGRHADRRPNNQNINQNDSSYALQSQQTNGISDAESWGDSNNQNAPPPSNMTNGHDNSFDAVAMAGDTTENRFINRGYRAEKGEYGELESPKSKYSNDLNGNGSLKHTKNGGTADTFANNHEAVKLKKEIGFVSGVAINVGVIIGSGIFVSPTSVIQNTQSLGLALVVWSVCGIFSLLGAICYAELGTTFPASGGEYAYIRAAFGDLPAFLYVWMCLLVLSTAGKAVNALAFSEYAIGPVFVALGHQNTPKIITKLVAVCLVTFLVFINCLKVRLATRVQTFFTFCKLFALVVIIIVGIYELAIGNYTRFSPLNAFKNSNLSPGKIALASYSGLYAYSGWNSLNYITEEVKNPSKTIPRTLFCSISIVTVIYVLANMAYMSVLDPYEMINSKVVAMSFIEKSLGYSYSIAISVFVAVSIFGGINGSILVASRIFFASARNGHFPILFSMINVKYMTPITSLFFIGLVTCLFSIFSNIINLINYYAFTEAFFSFMTIVALLYMRYKKPHLPRPFKVNIVIPIIFAIICLFLLTFPFSTDPAVCGIALALIISGIPVYYFFTYVSRFKWFKKVNGSILRFSQKVLYCVKEDEEIK